MSLPTTGPISLSQVAVELGRASNATTSLGETAVRNLAGVASGAISMQDLRGASSLFQVLITTNQTNLNLRDFALDAGWNGTAELEVEIQSGRTVQATGVGAACTVSGSFPNGVTLINRGTITGRGGAGGTGGSATTSVSNGAAGGQGGTALAVTVPLTLNNIGTLAGGGGGGGGGGAARGIVTVSGGEADATFQCHGAGGGGGGGRSNATNSPGGSPGAQSAVVRLSGDVGSPSSTAPSAGGQGTSSAAGGGGPLGSQGVGASLVRGGNGAAGSSNLGAAGNTGANGSTVGTVSVVSTSTGGAGGIAGRAVTGNSNITYISTGTRIGVIA